MRPDDPTLGGPPITPNGPPPDPFGNEGGNSANAWANAPGLQKFGGLPPGQGGTMPDGSQGDPNGFSRFQDNVNFLRHVNQHNMVPLWAHPDVANQMLAQHGPTGMVVPHPQINLDNLAE